MIRSDENDHFALVYAIAIENKRPQRPQRIKDDVWSLIQECWEPVEEKRPSIQKVQIKLSNHTNRPH